MDSKAIIHKTREDYNRIAGQFSGTRYDLWPELKPFENLIKDGQNILDWGCGNGRLLFLLKNKNVKYFGLDQSDELLKLAEHKWKQEIDCGKAQFFWTAEKEKQFEENFFDLVFLIASFHHLPDKETRLHLLKKIYGEMKPGAKLIMTVWNLESEWAQSKLKKDWKVMAENDYIIPWKNNKGEILVERYYHHFTKTELEELFSEAGFKKIELFYNDLTKWSGDKGGRNLLATAEK